MILCRSACILKVFLSLKLCEKYSSVKVYDNGVSVLSFLCSKFYWPTCISLRLYGCFSKAKQIFILHMPIRKRKIQPSVIIKQVGQTSCLIAAQISISHFSKTRDLRSGARRSCNIILKSISMHTKTGRKNKMLKSVRASTKRHNLCRCQTS